MELLDWIKANQPCVFFGGAGVSVPSGIPDFRSAQGLYNEFGESMLSHQMFVEKPKEFFDFYRNHLVFPSARPNIIHTTLAELEQAGLLSAVITQNIDGLHQMAGSQRVIELHGSIHRNICEATGVHYPLEKMLESDDIPKDEQGHLIRPEVVLFDEPLDMHVIHQAIAAIEAAKMVIVAGTSLVVWPAAGFLNAFRGQRFVIINKSPTAFDDRADRLYHEDAQRVFKQLHEALHAHKV